MQTESNVSKTGKQKIVTLIIHIVCIFMLFILPEITMNIGDNHHSTIPTGVYVKTIIYILVFYLNYFIIFDKCFNQPHSSARFVSYNLLLFFGAMTIIYICWLATAANHPLHGDAPPPPPHSHGEIPLHHHGPAEYQPGTPNHIAMTVTRFFRDAIMIFLTISLSLAIKLGKKWIDTERNRQARITIQREEELNNLKSQINPHFLFNSLNSIYALVDICPNKAKNAVHKLSHMLRYVLYENPPTVTLAQELRFIENYIELMRLRIGDRNNLSVDLNDNGHGDMPIAPLIFISVIENVFKHGDTQANDKQIEISIKAENGIVRCHTFNRYSHIDPTREKGIGLTNLKRRLNLIYGNNASLFISSDDETFTVDIIIDLNPS